MSSFEGLRGFRDAVVAMVGMAVDGGARELLMVDADFEGWPFDDPALLDALTRFVRQPGRRLTLLARRYDRVAREYPRFVSWRRTWGHAVEVRSPSDVAAELPCLAVVDRSRAVSLDVSDRQRGEVVDLPPQVHRLREPVDAVLQRAEPAFAQTTLGL